MRDREGYDRYSRDRGGYDRDSRERGDYDRRSRGGYHDGGGYDRAPFGGPPRGGGFGRAPPGRRPREPTFERAAPEVGANVSMLMRSLSDQVTEADIRGGAEAFGSVEDVYLPRNYYTKKLRGIAFVQFGSEAACTAAVEGLNGQEICGQPVACEVAKHGRKKVAGRTGYQAGSKTRSVPRQEGSRPRDSRRAHAQQARPRPRSRSRSRSMSPEGRFRRAHSHSRSRSPPPRGGASTGPSALAGGHAAGA